MLLAFLAGGSTGRGNSGYKIKNLYAPKNTHGYRTVAPSANLRNTPAAGFGNAPVRNHQNSILPQKKFPGAGPQAYRICKYSTQKWGPAPGKVSPGGDPRGTGLTKKLRRASGGYLTKHSGMMLPIHAGPQLPGNPPNLQKRRALLLFRAQLQTL